MNKNNIAESELAAYLGISEAMLYDLLSAYTEPSDELLKKITVFFSLPESYLIGVPENATISEPKHSGGGIARIVPVVVASKAASGLIKDTDIVNTVNLNLTDIHDRNEYIGIRVERDAVIDRHLILAGCTVMVNMTNQLSNGDAVAFSKRGKPVEFRRYTRSGPVITLYSYEDKNPISFNVGDTDYKILGSVRSFEVVL